MKRWSVLLAVLAFVFAVMPAEEAEAQGVNDDYNRVISMNPIGLVLGVLSAEGEQGRSDTTSMGIAVSLFTPTGFTYLSVEGKYRYYPQGEAMRGFSVGGGVGLASVSASTAFEDDSSVGFTIGVFLDYQAFLGDDERFAVVGGIGGKRVLLFDDIAGADLTYPTIRVGIGYAL